ncbi:MAG: amidohydrolase [Ignavibacteriaceae bacterium]|nr:amidohydrolase [Ignavibacteriaceae bacterium]
MKLENSANELINFRRLLHKCPELSGKEIETAKKIVRFANTFDADKILTQLGGNGVAVIFEGKEKGKTILIRCDLDALPISEENGFEYKSVFANVSHKCGHDGHMAIVSGLFRQLSEEKLTKGKVVLLFQPAEETGEGAKLILNDSKFTELNPDYVFALHNLPGFAKHQIVIKYNEFASASKGLIIRLTGKTSHAAEPEKGITPTLAVAELIYGLLDIPKNKSLKDFSLVTIIHSKIGERAFGTTPGYAELMATVRTYKNEDMLTLTNCAEELINKAAVKHKLKFEIEWVEQFPATVNSKECVDIISASAKENNFVINKINEPFRWSEDFGYFTQKYRGAFFGIGAGENLPQLHNPDYDFPDEIIVTGVKMFYSIIKKVLA